MERITSSGDPGVLHGVVGGQVGFDVEDGRAVDGIEATNVDGRAIAGKEGDGGDAQVVGAKLAAGGEDAVGLTAFERQLVWLFGRGFGDIEVRPR